MEWIKKHTDTVVLLGALFSGFLWINGKFHDVEVSINELDKRLVKIETIIYLKGLVAQEIASSKGEK